MNRYIYNYQTTVLFSAPVTRHSIMLRAQPFTNAYITVEEEHVLTSPSFHLRYGLDQLGNRIAYGYSSEAHSSLVTVSCGMVLMEDYYASQDPIPLTVYKQPTHLTYLPHTDPLSLPSDAAMAAQSICHHVSLSMRYVPNVTTHETPAAEVAIKMMGVCQDYAHMMIAICRANGIAARYACGFMEGEGETHAWVEVWDGNKWIGFDPTNDTIITQGYLKVAHGRDAADCPVSRGLFAGTATQQTNVSIMLHRI